LSDKDHVMNPRLVFKFTLLVALCAPAASSAQVQTELTLTLPVQMTRIGPDVTKVMVRCRISSLALPPVLSHRQVDQQQELPITGGAVNTTVTMVFSLAGLEDPVGKSATIACMLTGWSASTQQWLLFTADAVNPSFRTTEPTTLYQGHSFTW
jgi:hypothetical protein